MFSYCYSCKPLLVNIYRLESYPKFCINEQISEAPKLKSYPELFY